MGAGLPVRSHDIPQTEVPKQLGEVTSTRVEIGSGASTEEASMKPFEAKTTINDPAQSVFDYVSDFTKHGEWAGHGLQVTKETDGPVAIGSTYSTVAKQFGTQREHSTVTELEPGMVFGWDSKGALGTAHHRFTVATSDGATSLTKSADLT